MEARIASLTKPYEWLNQYMNYTRHTEAPAAFHLLTALCVVGAAIGRGGWIAHGVHNVYPNLYALLVAPSGRCRKSSAVKLGVQLLQRAELPHVKVAGPKVTPEALLQIMRRERPTIQQGKVVPVFPPSITFVYAPELAVFLTTREFSKDTVPLLTDLYDSPDVWSTYTIARGEVHLRNVFVCCLMASTPEWLVELIPRSAFGGGFMGRLMVAALDNTTRCFPMPQPPSISQRDELVEGLKRIEQIQGAVVLKASAQRKFIDWYVQSRQVRDKERDDRISGYLERKPLLLLKILAILVRSAGHSCIRDTDFDAALNVLELYEAGMFKLFNSVSMKQEGARAFDAAVIQRLKDYLATNTFTRYQTLIGYMSRLGITASRTRELLYTLQEAGYIAMRSSSTQDGGTQRVIKYLGVEHEQIQPITEEEVGV